MQVHLLYPDREWKGTQRYFDYKSIIADLGLEVLFRTAAREQLKQEGAIQKILEADAYLENAMRQVMMVPLENSAQICYRQDILKDFLENEELIRELYAFASETLALWDRLGRRQNEKNNIRDAGVNLVTDVYLLRLFTTRLHMLKELLERHQQTFHSQGLCCLLEGLQQDFSPEMEEQLNQILEDISFYVDKEADPFERRNKKIIKKAYIMLQCEISQGLKFGSFKLEEVETLGKKYKRHKHKRTLMQKYLGAFASSPSMLLKEDILLAETMQLEYQIVHYLTSCCDSFLYGCREFFDELCFQTAFYRGALNLLHRLERHQLAYCYPSVGAQQNLKFRELKDFGMAIEQLTNPVGNASDIRGKRLLVVTGANQGGKSTFLRSIGLAQVMMQCGLFVAAESFESGIFPAFFTHFTRREDSEMNSGRLDEELGRMNQIIENLGERSLVLLNESFATTTEKEGSVIAYDIVKAMTEAGVKVLTVTHLLSFAKRVYEEGSAGAEFLSAERLPDGRRTFKMIQHAPELTSFGLDLYEQMVGETGKGADVLI
ncbi:MAG: hypothetical protein HFI75_09185 [Lachnospiraceae bacterium]|nr:hypothetical protein [Lachnospiraceae bacterium]